jgi:ribosomal protein S18 acetylase RimI-like enzyme
MPKIEIVPATQKDLPVILEMIQALAEYEKLTHLVTATEEQLQKTLFADRPAAEVLLAYMGRECAGFAVYFTTYSTFAAQPGLYLEDLYVRPQLRGNGAGLALLRRLAAIATERGCSRVDWEVLNWNEPAIGFYKKLGAVPVEEWTKYRLSGEALEGLARQES